MKQRESVDMAPLFLAEHNRSNIVKKQKLSQDYLDLLARGLHDQSITALVRVGVPEPAPPLLIDKKGRRRCARGKSQVQILPAATLRERCCVNFFG